MRRGRVKTLMRENGLLLACLGLFAVFFVGMVISGAATYNQEQQEHGSHEQVSVIGYLATGDFVEAMFENWESEFLQMGMYVVLTAFLFQKGSSESKPLHGSAPQDEDPRSVTPNRWMPWPVRKGGWVLGLYEHSLAIAFFVLFFASFGLHAVGGAKAFNAEQAQHRRSAGVDLTAVVAGIHHASTARSRVSKLHPRPSPASSTSDSDGRIASVCMLEVMSESTSTPEPATTPVSTTTSPEPAYVEREPRRSRLTAVAAWVGIVAGVVFIVAVVFFSGFILGSHSGGHRGGHHGGGDRDFAMLHRGGPPPMFPMGPMGQGPRFERPPFGPGGPGGPADERPEPPQPPTTAPSRP